MVVDRLKYREQVWLMWEKECQKPPMTGNGKHDTYNISALGDGLGA